MLTRFVRTPLALMPDRTFLGATPGYDEHKITGYAVAHGIWLQDDGVIPGRTLSAPWGQTPIIAEMRNPTGRTGNNLKADLTTALSEHPAIILVFTSDLTNPANRALIHTIATQTGIPSQTSNQGPATCTPAHSRPASANPGTTGSAPLAAGRDTHPGCRRHQPPSAPAAKPRLRPHSH